MIQLVRSIPCFAGFPRHLRALLSSQRYPFLLTRRPTQCHSLLSSLEPRCQKGYFLYSILTVNVCGNYREKCAVDYRCICHCDPERFAVMEGGVMILTASSLILRYGTLLPLSTVCCSVISSVSPHTAKMYMIFFRHFQLFNAESSKFRALVWPMGGVLA